MAVSGQSAVEVNDALTLTCSVDSSPAAAITWRFNNTARPETTKVLRIAKVAYRDAGLYACQALNAKTQRNATATFQLSVKGQSPPLTGGPARWSFISVSPLC